MSQTTLIEKITADADVAVAHVQSQSEIEVAEIERESREKIAQIQKDAAAQLEKQKHQHELVATSRAKQAGNIALQKAKRAQIDAVFQQVFSELTTQTSDDYITFFTKQAEAVIPKNIEVIKVHAPASRTEETAKILSTLSIDAEIVASSHVSAGLIAFTKDGVYDASFDRVFAEKRADLEMIIVNELMA